MPGWLVHGYSYRMAIEIKLQFMSFMNRLQFELAMVARLIVICTGPGLLFLFCTNILFYTHFASFQLNAKSQIARIQLDNHENEMHTTFSLGIFSTGNNLCQLN